MRCTYLEALATCARLAGDNLLLRLLTARRRALPVGPVLDELAELARPPGADDGAAEAGPAGERKRVAREKGDPGPLGTVERRLSPRRRQLERQVGPRQGKDGKAKEDSLEAEQREILGQRKLGRQRRRRPGLLERGRRFGLCQGLVHLLGEGDHSEDRGRWQMGVEEKEATAGEPKAERAEPAVELTLTRHRIPLPSSLSSSRPQVNQRGYVEPR